jgi:orotate phosphoribosyltransferase-like protein
MNNHQQVQDIKIALIKKGMTVTRLAKELSYSRTTVSLAINHHQRGSVTVLDAVITFLEIPKSMKEKACA